MGLVSKGGAALSHVDDLLEIMMMSFALGMDALSLSIGVGLGSISRKTAVQLCAFIGVFHVALTLIGIGFGDWIGDYLGAVAKWFGALLIIGLGVHMAYHTLFSKEEKRPRTIDSLFSLAVFAASVSIDALSVGFSLGLRSAAYGAASAIAFGVVSCCMCGAGLAIGRKFGQAIGHYGELAGACILILCGIGFLH